MSYPSTAEQRWPVDVGKIDRFVTIRKVIERGPMKVVVPMGINVANMTRGSDLDRLFAQIRDAHCWQNQTSKLCFQKGSHAQATQDRCRESHRCF